jgi:glutamate-5-semialdehyde dehydrogenase
MREFVDVIVPRGGKGLIERLLAECARADDPAPRRQLPRLSRRGSRPEQGAASSRNAKTQRYGTCNTAESLLIDRSVAAMLLPPIAHMLAAKGVEIRGCAETCAIVQGSRRRHEEDYYTEYLAPIISVKVVAGIDEAIAHINTYSSHHTEAIVTENYTRRRCASCARWIRPRSWSMPRRASPTASSTAWAPRSAFPPTRSTPAARWASKA